MQLNNLDKKSLIELKEEIADLERRVKEISTLRVKQNVPLEVLLEQSVYKEVWDDTFAEAEAQARALISERDPKPRWVEGERLTYSAILENGKRYEQVGDGIIGLFALKIVDGMGVFDFMVSFMERPFFTFTAIQEEKYFLLPRGILFHPKTWFEVKAIEGHVRYILAMSTFLNPKLKEVK